MMFPPQPPMLPQNYPQMMLHPQPPMFPRNQQPMMVQRPLAIHLPHVIDPVTRMLLYQRYVTMGDRGLYPYSMILAQAAARLMDTNQ